MPKSSAQQLHVIIYGASGHGKVIAEMIDSRPHLKLLGFIDDVKWARGEKTFFGRPILGDKNYISPKIIKSGIHFVLGIGDNAVRRKVARALEEKKIRWLAIVDARAVISNSAVIGEGAVIMPGAIINADTAIGRHSIVNTGATIDHDCSIGDYSHTAPGTNLAGNVRIGIGTMIGIGSCVRQNITIGRETTVGAGSVVVSDLPDQCVAYGVPAKIRKRNKV